MFIGANLSRRSTGGAQRCPAVSRRNRGFSLIEMLVGITLFALIFIQLLKLHSEANMPMQAMIRDYGAVMNLSQQFLNSIQNDIMAGDLPPLNGEVDVTEAMLERGGNAYIMKLFADGSARQATELTVNFKALLSVEDVGSQTGAGLAGSFYRVKIRCQWGRSRQQHYETALAVYRR